VQPCLHTLICLYGMLRDKFALPLHVHTHTHTHTFSLPLSLFPYLRRRGSTRVRRWYLRTAIRSSFWWHCLKFVVFYGNTHANIIASQHNGIEFILKKGGTIKVSSKRRKRIIQGRNVYTIKTEYSNTPLCKLRQSQMKYCLKVTNYKRNDNANPVSYNQQIQTTEKIYI